MHRSAFDDHLAMLFAKAPVGMSELTLDGRFVRVNDALCQILGRSHEELLALGVADVTYPEDLPASRGALAQMTTTGASVSLDKRYVCPDGTLIWARSSLTRIHDPQGRPLGVLAVTVDLSERKRAEDALAASEEHYRTLFESIDDGFCMFELLYDDGRVADYRFLHVNRVFERQTGLKDAVGTLGSESAPHTEAHWLEAYDRVARTGEALRLEQYNQATGRWYSVYASRVGGPGSRQVCTVFSDITERKRAEVALRASEERQAFLLKLSDALRAEPDADAVASRALQMLVEQLRLDRCWLSQVFEQQQISTVGPEHRRPDLPPMVGVFQLSDYPETMRQLATQPMVIHDAANDTGFSDSEQALLAQLHLRALLVAPLRKGQQQVIWALAAAMATPRTWTEAERVLLEEVAERTWAAVERARAEAALRESEARFRTLADAVPQVIWANEADGRATYFNQRWYDYTGLSYEQSAGPGWQAIVHPDDAPASTERWQRALEQGTVFDAEYRLRRADGTYRWHLGRNVPLRDQQGRITGWFGSATDIEDLKQYEAALQASEERLRLVIASVQEYAIVTLDAAGRVISWNSGAQQIFNYDADAVLGRDVALLFTPEDRAAGIPERERQHALVTGHAVEDRWHQRADGSRFFASGVLSTVRDGAGRVRWFVKVARDLTAQREAEEALRRAHDELEARVQERTAELSRLSTTRQQLLERLVSAQEDERRRIARELHDSLGQYLSALALELARIQAVPGVKPDVGSGLARLQTLAREIDAELDSLTMELRPPALDDLGLDEALRRYAQEWSETSAVEVELVTSGFARGRLPVAAEATAYRVVQEALTNVRKHAQARHVSVVLERRETVLQVIIEDDGVGFEPETIARERSGGRQLGLVGMQERATLAGGAVTIESEPGTGTTIFLRLPLTGERGGASDE